MKYLVIYNESAVLICSPYTIGVSVSLGSAFSIVAELASIKLMLNAANIDYSNFEELKNA